MKLLVSATALSTIPIERFDQPVDATPVERYGCRLRGSASQGDTHAASFDRGVQSAAAVDFLLKSVRLEIDEDLEETAHGEAARPTQRTILRAIEVARELAMKFHRQPWVDVVGFVADRARAGVLAHSMETGRRITFYAEGDRIRAIRAAVSGRPDWFEPLDMEEVRLSLDWIARID